MQTKNASQAPTINEPTLEVFNFSETQTEIRSLLIDGNPYFVGNDVAKALGYSNSRKALSDHCRYVTIRYIPHPQNVEKKLKVQIIPESDVYRLIIKSTLPTAEKFERWVMEEVLPSIRKKGYYTAVSRQNDFIDARDVPYRTEVIHNYNVRVIFINEKLYLLNDLRRCIGSTTSNHQTVKKLNAKSTLAHKVWIFGNTNPAWFVNELGKELLFSGSRIVRSNNAQQLLLPFTNQEGGAL